MDSYSCGIAAAEAILMGSDRRRVSPTGVSQHKHIKDLVREAAAPGSP